MSRSQSLVGLLYLPVPENPIALPRPRSAPTPLRPSDPELLAAGETWIRGMRIRLDAELPWRSNEHAADRLLHAGEEVLALARAANGGHPWALALARRLLDDWIEHNPIPSAPGWESLVLARRLTCWSAAFAELCAKLEPGTQRAWLASLHLQARFLASNLPEEPDGSAALTALRALAGAGSVIAGVEPRGWLELARRELPRALAALTSPDGVHRSRRPDRHLAALADLGDVLALLPGESEAARHGRELLPAMRRVARALAHPDGGPAGFGGAGYASAPELGQLLAPQSEHDLELPRTMTFPDAGFSAFRPGPGDAILVDWLGPGQEPGASGAAGSFELSFDGERLVVSAANDGHSPGAQHSSGAADGRSFRTPRPDAAGHLAGGLWGEGPGYAYLGLELVAQGAELMRRMLVFDGRALAVVDRIRGAERSAETRIQLAPGVTLSEAGPRQLYLHKNGVTATLAWMPGAAMTAEASAAAGPHGEPLMATALRLWAPGGGTRLVGYLLAAGRRPDAAIDVMEQDGERIGVRFDPRRYLLRWDPKQAPRLLLAD